MASYFTLELDTTSPILEIDAPVRSIPQNVVEITITANEALALYQDIYIIDVLGVRRDYIFQRISETELVGYVDLQDYNIGFATIYAQLKDEVFNESILTTRIIYVGYVQRKVYEAHVFGEQRTPDFNESFRSISFVSSSRNVLNSENTRNPSLTITSRNIELEASTN